MNKGGGFAYKSHSAEVGIGDVKEAEELGCEEGSVQRFFHYSAPLLHIADTHLSLSLSPSPSPSISSAALPACRLSSFYTSQTETSH